MPELISGERSSIKSEFEIYMETGILGGYAPERVIGFQEGDRVTPVYRDADCVLTDKGLELHREMVVGGRKFFVRSIFSNTEKAKTPTEQMLQIIDSDLEKGSI